MRQIVVVVLKESPGMPACTAVLPILWDPRTFQRQHRSILALKGCDTSPKIGFFWECSGLLLVPNFLLGNPTPVHNPPPKGVLWGAVPPPPLSHAFQESGCHKLSLGFLQVSRLCLDGTPHMGIKTPPPPAADLWSAISLVPATPVPAILFIGTSDFPKDFGSILPGATGTMKSGRNFPREVPGSQFGEAELSIPPGLAFSQYAFHFFCFISVCYTFQSVFGTSWAFRIDVWLCAGKLGPFAKSGAVRPRLTGRIPPFFFHKLFVNFSYPHAEALFPLPPPGPNPRGVLGYGLANTTMCQKDVPSLWLMQRFRRPHAPEVPYFPDYIFPQRCFADPV